MAKTNDGDSGRERSDWLTGLIWAAFLVAVIGGGLLFFGIGFSTTTTQTIAVPAASAVSQTSCVENLTRLQTAVRKWSSDNNITDTDAEVTMEDISGSLNEPIPDPVNSPNFSCPDGGTYSVSSLGEPPECSLNRPGHELGEPR